MFQNVEIIGRLGKDPETKHTSGGDTITTFSVAVSKKYKDRSGEQKETTTWFNCKSWRKQAEWAQALQKGDSVFVKGEIAVEKWEDKEGNKKSNWFLTTQLIQLTSWPTAEGQEQKPSGQGASNDADEIPF